MAKTGNAELIARVMKDLNTTPEQVANTYRLMSTMEFKNDWGRILKGDLITKAFEKDVQVLREHFELGDKSHSVAVGVMLPGSFHEPFIRHASGDIEYDPTNMRAYKVVSGSFTCTRVTENGRELLDVTPQKGLIVVNDLDIFSFKAGPRGCVFAIVDFPEFDLTQDLNNIRAVQQKQ